MYSPIAAAFRLSAFVAWTLIAIPPYVLAMALRWRYRAFAMFYWRGVARIVGIILVTRGRPAVERPLLCVANHASYLDIVALGALIPGAFVAKAEVESWPGFGLIARLGRTIFIQRRRLHAAGHRDDLTRRLAEGEPLVMFPEGTSSDGNRVLPFKSSLFSVAEADIDGRPVGVQPVSVAYTRLGGLPMGYGWRPYYAWYGDMELMPHLWRVLTLGRVTVEVCFHEPVSRAALPSRKALAAHCHRVIATGVAEALSGRPRLDSALRDVTF